MAGPELLVVWDFDYSLINENCDTYPFDRLTPELKGKMKELRKSDPDRFGSGHWTDLMDHMMTLLAREGVEPAALEESLADVPIFQENILAVQLAAAAGAEQRILSDANSVFIPVILKAKNIAEHFSTIVTNPACYESDEGGCGKMVLRVRPVQPRDTPHGCSFCPVNLCKGDVLDAWIAEVRPARIIYVGDGGGDFCPALRLRQDDVVCARRGFSLEKKLVAAAEGSAGTDVPASRAQMLFWQDGAELLAHFQSVLETKQQGFQ